MNWLDPSLISYLPSSILDILSRVSSSSLFFHKDSGIWIVISFFANILLILLRVLRLNPETESKKIKSSLKSTGSIVFLGRSPITQDCTFGGGENAFAGTVLRYVTL